MTISRAKGPLRAHSAQERCEAVSETLTPAEAERRNGVRDRVLGDSRDDVAIRDGLSYPAFVIRNVAEEPSVALKKGVSSRLAIVESRVCICELP
jgi:hypothetical protein